MKNAKTDTHLYNYPIGYVQMHYQFPGLVPLWATFKPKYVISQLNLIAGLSFHKNLNIALFWTVTWEI